MKNLTSRFAVAIAAASMAFAPVAAQANTRAGDSASIYSATAAQPGVSRSSAEVEGEDLVGRRGILAILFGAAAVVGIILLLDDDDTQSPGAN